MSEAEMNNVGTYRAKRASCAMEPSQTHQDAKRKSTRNREKDVLHPPGVEPGPIAWKAIILPLDQECLMEESGFGKYRLYTFLEPPRTIPPRSFLSAFVSP